jgi:hypothetical protein
VLPFPSNSAQEAMIMRLTDQPKTLAEMKPEIEWPGELQAVMDKVLARDADERYQKSADFGRDMAKSVENMPATVAAAAGTMVMGAPAAADVPKTRMASKGGATEKVEAPVAAAPVRSAPAKKSPVMIIAAAVVVIAIAGTAAVFMKGGSGASASPSGSAPANSAPPVKPQDPAASAPAPNAGNASADPRGGGATDTKHTKAPAVQLMGKPTAAAPTENPVAPPASTATAAATIASWQKKFEDTDHPATEADAKAAIAVINPLLEKLSGVDRSNAAYVQMLAYGLMDSDALFCNAYKEVVGKDGNTNHLKTAAMLQQGRCK